MQAFLLKKGSEPRTGICCRSSPVRNANRNVYGMAFCTFAHGCAYHGLANIQSSVNMDAGLGLVSMAVLEFVYMVSAIFTVGIVNSIGTKYSLIVGLVGYLIYVVLCYHPSWYTLIPGGLVAGLTTGPIWIAASCHVIAIAGKMAPVLKERHDVLVGRYIGIIYLSYQLAAIPGNLASSLIFHFSEKYGNSSHDNGTTEDCDLLNTFGVERIYIYILVSFYVFVQVLSILAAFLFLTDASSIPETRLGKVKALLTASTIKKVFNKKMLILAPVGIYNGLQLSISSGIFAQVYISDCLGISKVGFFLILFAVSSAAVSSVCGTIVKYVPECLVLLLAGLIDIGLIIFLLVWKREPSYAAVIIFVIGWGVADAIWEVMYSGFVAYLFPLDTTAAFGAASVWQGLGLTVGFLVSHLASRNIAVILYLLLGMIIVAAIVYSIALVSTKTVEQIFPYSVYCPRRMKNYETIKGSDTSLVKKDVSATDEIESTN